MLPSKKIKICLKCVIFSKKIAKLNVTYTNCTAIRSNFVAHKKSILISKIWGDFSKPSLCDIAPSLHLVWRRTDWIHSRGRKNGCFWGFKILIFPKAIQFYQTKSARGCMWLTGCIPISYTALIESIILINKAYKCSFLSIKILLKLKLPGILQSF